MTSVEAIAAAPFLDGIVYGEGPRWHGDRLWFTDGLAGRVYSAGEAGDLAIEVELARASGLGWLPDGTLVVSTLFAAELHQVDATGNVTASYDISDVAWSTNDLLVAPDGRTFVDLYIADGGTIAGGIGLVGADGAVRVVARGLSMPNGLGMLPDGSTLVVSETHGSRLLAFTVGLDGGLGDPTVFAELGPERHPDGLCIDAAGGVWVGCYDTGEFLRVGGGGEITHRIEIDRGWAVAPALGGHDGRTLYLVVDDTTHEGLLAGSSTGRILQARVGVPGVGSP